MNETYNNPRKFAMFMPTHHTTPHHTTPQNQYNTAPRSFSRLRSGFSVKTFEISKKIENFTVVVKKRVCVVPVYYHHVANGCDSIYSL